VLPPSARCLPGESTGDRAEPMLPSELRCPCCLARFGCDCVPPHVLRPLSLRTCGVTPPYAPAPRSTRWNEPETSASGCVSRVLPPVGLMVPSLSLTKSERSPRRRRRLQSEDRGCYPFRSGLGWMASHPPRPTRPAVNAGTRPNAKMLIRSGHSVGVTTDGDLPGCLHGRSETMRRHG
jgi:hypothetical protein